MRLDPMPNTAGQFGELGRALRAAANVELVEWEEQGTGDVIIRVGRSGEPWTHSATLYRAKLEAAGRYNDALDYLRRFREGAVDAALNLIDRTLGELDPLDYYGAGPTPAPPAFTMGGLRVVVTTALPPGVECLLERLEAGRCTASDLPGTTAP